LGKDSCAESVITPLKWAADTNKSPSNTLALGKR